MAYTMWRIEISGFKRKKVLSVRKKVEYTPLELTQYMGQYAIDNQININALSVRQFAEHCE